ncbi:unnamed protein product, partial [Choristocarpus tenellus]
QGKVANGSSNSTASLGGGDEGSGVSAGAGGSGKGSKELEEVTGALVPAPMSASSMVLSAVKQVPGYRDLQVEETPIPRCELVLLEEGHASKPMELDLTVFAWAPHFRGMLAALEGGVGRFGDDAFEAVKKWPEEVVTRRRLEGAVAEGDAVKVMLARRRTCLRSLGQIVIDGRLTLPDLRLRLLKLLEDGLRQARDDKRSALVDRAQPRSNLGLESGTSRVVARTVVGGKEGKGEGDQGTSAEVGGSGEGDDKNSSFAVELGVKDEAGLDALHGKVLVKKKNKKSRGSKTQRARGSNDSGGG